MLYITVPPHTVLFSTTMEAILYNSSSSSSSRAQNRTFKYLATSETYSEPSAVSNHFSRRLLVGLLRTAVFQ